MSNFDYNNYLGNAIFRNQPSHSYFDKPFDEEDCLFRYLHEIDPHFLRPEQKLQTLNVNQVTITDPRTQKSITQLSYDHTEPQEKRTQIFRSPQKSFLTQEQHELGVRVLRALQQSVTVEKKDMLNWCRIIISENRSKEIQYFQTFVFEYHQNNKTQMYADCRKLLELYQKWHKSKSIRLLKKYPQQSYNTHLGLPQVSQCKHALKQQRVEITNIEIVRNLGKIGDWSDNFKEEFKKLKHCLAAYADVYINSEELEESLEDNIKTEFLRIAAEETENVPLLYIPLESLLFLLTTGEYIDTPTEMLLNIKEIESDDGTLNKYIIMDQPLPSRHVGTHSYQQVFEQAARAMISIRQMKLTEEEISAGPSVKSSNSFKLTTVQDYMQKTKTTAHKHCQFSKTLTKWQLSSEEDHEAVTIYTSLDTFTNNQNFTIKLEYKPTFGCEILTKYELLKQWFQLKFLPQTPEACCLRLDIHNYQTLLEEPLNLHKLEHKLFAIHQINCRQLQYNMFDFFKMLCNMPADHYMLRFNPKFKDKLMLCKPSQEFTQNTIHLHQLLQSEVSDIQFMSQPTFLPIDENLCSLMHLQHNILPSTFSPQAAPEKRFYEKFCATKQKKKVKKVKKPTTKQKYESIEERAKRQRMLEDLELAREMELDRKMLVTV